MGRIPPVFPPARTGRRVGDLGPPHPVDPALLRGGSCGPARVRVEPVGVRQPPDAGGRHARRAADRCQLGHLRGRRGGPPCDRGVIGLLPQPDRDRGDRRDRPARTASRSSVAGDGDRAGRRGLSHDRLRTPAVDRSEPGVLVRSLWADEEAARHLARRLPEPDLGDGGAGPDRARHPRVAQHPG